MEGEQRRTLDRRSILFWIGYYGRLGWRMFPAAGKRPLLKNWPEFASADPDEVTQWFRRPANIGLICGEAFDVFDIEAPHVSAFIEYVGILPETPIVRTGRGGLHIYVLPTGARGNRRLILNNVHIGELKSKRGGVLAPPSVTDAPYRWLWAPDGMELAVASQAMERLIPPEPRIRRFPAKITSAVYGVKKLQALAACVARTPEGQRNAILYWAARRGLEEGIPPQYLFRGLADAALAAGLRHHEITATLRSAYRHCR